MLIWFAMVVSAGGKTTRKTCELPRPTGRQWGPADTFVERCNSVRLHHAIGDITSADNSLRLEQVVFQERDRELGEALLRRWVEHQHGPSPVSSCRITLHLGQLVSP
ncbi:MAG: hypothetical protein ACK55Z_05560 [bacterium]